MPDLPALVFAMLGGILLGALFFGGLWWTVQKGMASEVPAVWFLVSMLLRIGLVLAGFWFVSEGHWSRIVACLVGFLMARVVVVRRLTRVPLDEGDPLEQEHSVAHQSR